MKKTLTAMALASSILPITESNAESNPEVLKLNNDDTFKSDSINEASTIQVKKDSLSATVYKDNAVLIDKDGNKVEKLKSGDKLQILKRLTNEPFTKVNHNGRALFIANDSITDSKVSSSSKVELEFNSFAKVVNLKLNDTLNVRDTDSANGKVLFTLKPNAGVNVSQVTTNGWYKIEYYGNYGFVNSKYIELLNPSVPGTPYKGYAQVTSKISAKEIPSSYSKSTFNLPLNAGVDTVKKTSNNWYKIKYYDKTGFIESKNLKILSYEDPNKPNFTVTPVDNIWSKIVTTSTSVAGKKYPSKESATICSLNNGAGVYITGETSNGWYQLKFYDKTVYVPMDNVKKLTPSTPDPVPPTPEPPDEEIVPDFTVTDFNMEGVVHNVASNDTLNIREYPDASSKLITTLNNNARVSVTGKTSNGWYRVNANGKVGYANSKYIKEYVPETTKYKVVDNDIYLRTSPSWSGEKYKLIKTGEILDVISIENEWASVYIDKTIVYAPTSHLKSLDSIPPTPDEEYVPETTKYRVVNSDIYLRTSPSWSGDKYKLIKTGEILDVVSIENEWASIYIDKTVVYAPASHLESLDSIPSTPEPPMPESPDEEVVPEFTVTDLSMNGVVYNVASNDTLNIREYPDASSKLVTTLANNSRVSVTGKTSNGWYRVNVDGKVGYGNSKYIKEYIPETTEYKVVNSNINLRFTPSWGGAIHSSAKVGEILNVISIDGEWASIYKDKNILYAPSSYLSKVSEPSNPDITPEDKTIYTKYPFTLKEYIKIQSDTNSKYDETYFENYINPLKCNKFEFLRLDKFRNIDVSKLNQMLSNKNAGVLIGQGQAIANTAKKYNIDPIYFVSQSIHETGYGKSTLAKGVLIHEIADENYPIKDSNGNITGYKMIPLPEPVTVYNLYGIGAKDNLPTMPNRALILGTTYAYNKGWTSVEKAIDGAGAFVSSGYINSTKYKQNTLYKIKYNQNPNYIWHQYATTPWYSRDIAKFIEEYQYIYTDKDFDFDKPLFNGMQEYSLSNVRSVFMDDNHPTTKPDITLS